MIASDNENLRGINAAGNVRLSLWPTSVFWLYSTSVFYDYGYGAVPFSMGRCGISITIAFNPVE